MKKYIAQNGKNFINTMIYVGNISTRESSMGYCCGTCFYCYKKGANTYCALHKRLVGILDVCWDYNTEGE